MILANLALSCSTEDNCLGSDDWCVTKGVSSCVTTDASETGSSKLIGVTSSNFLECLFGNLDGNSGFSFKLVLFFSKNSCDNLTTG